MADDLRHFLQADGGTGLAWPPRGPVSPPPGSTQEATPPPITSGRSDSDQRPIKIVPKGLRSFDAHDADFFLELLPGPRDRDGLPESIRFWKTRIEADRPRQDVRGRADLRAVGLRQVVAGQGGLAAPAGRARPAGLRRGDRRRRPRPGCSRACGRRVPTCPADRGWSRRWRSLRRGRILPPGQKVLLVLDQFEQWLHARRGEENTELVAALRQCDGERVQAVVMVRDDFWMAATRFMRDLEIRLVEGENTRRRRSLRPAPRPEGAGGVRAGLRDACPSRIGDLSRGPERVPRSSRSPGWPRTARSSRCGWPCSPRWSRASRGRRPRCREVGGTEGVGVTFLEETFSAATAPPEHRLHQKAARAVLKALLPETGTDIKGQMRSRQELLEASGYASRPRDFDDLIRILDGELRLITPTDPEGSASEGPADHAERAILPAHPRLPGPLAAGLADPQAAGDPAGAGGTAAGGTGGALERQAREPPPAVRPGMGEHPAADEEEGLDRAAAPDDEAGGAGAWSSRRPDPGSPGWGRSCRDRRSSPGHRESAGHPGGRVWSSDSWMRTHPRSPRSWGRCVATAAGSILR